MTLPAPAGDVFIEEPLQKMKAPAEPRMQKREASIIQGLRWSTIQFCSFMINTISCRIRMAFDHLYPLRTFKMHPWPRHVLKPKQGY